MSNPEPMPAFFLGGDRDGESMFFPGRLPSIFMPVANEYPPFLWRETADGRYVSRNLVEEYQLRHAVLLYDYKGRRDW